VAPKGKREEMLDFLLCLKGPAEAARGCRACWIFQDTVDDHILTYLVLWNAEDELEEHIRSERFRRLLPYIEMSVEPPDIEISAVDRFGGIEFLLRPRLPMNLLHDP
jgi:hypothetical protein